MRSSAPSPTRAVCIAAISGTSPSGPITRWWSCPPKLSHETVKALERTRIQGILINLQPDRPPRKAGKKQPQIEMTLSKERRRARRPGVGQQGRAGRVAHRNPRGRGAARDAHPRRLHHGQVHPRLRRVGVLADGDRRADLLRALRVPVVRTVGQGRRDGRRCRRRCAATPGTGCGGSCRPTPSPCWRPTCSTTSARPGRIPGTRGGVVPQPDADADLHRQLPVFVSAPRAYADVEPGGRGRVLRRAAAAGLPAAGGAVPTAVAAGAADDRPGGPGVDHAGVADPGAHHRLSARRCAAVAADVSRVVHRRHDAGGPAADGRAGVRAGVRSVGAGVLLHRVDTDRRRSRPRRRTNCARRWRRRPSTP